LPHIPTDSQATLGDIDICSPQDKRKILSWNSVEIPIDPASSVLIVPDLISSQVRSYPSKIGIDAWDGLLTYDEIERYSSALAVYIHKNFGLLTAVDIIPIFFARSRWVPMDILAIQKMRKAYMALDPGHPNPRLSQLIAQVRAKVVITDQGQASRFKIEMLVIN